MCGFKIKSHHQHHQYHKHKHQIKRWVKLEKYQLAFGDILEMLSKLEAKMHLHLEICQQKWHLKRIFLSSCWTITNYYKLGHIKKLQKSDSGRDWLRSEIQKRVQFFWWVDKNPRSRWGKKKKCKENST